MLETIQTKLYELAQLSNHLVQTQLTHLTWVSIGVIFAAGLLTSLTPCMLSMLPITIGYIGGYEAENRLQAAIQSTWFALGLATTLAGLGIAIVNDFKSVEGDRQLGLKSLPVMFGITTAAWICVLMIDIFQAGVAVYLVSIQQNLYATILLLLVIPQITFQDMYFLRNPVENDVKYQASAQPFLVLGMLVVGLALGHAV